MSKKKVEPPWIPIIPKEGDPNPYRIIMLPVGGEFRVYADGTVDVIEGASGWSFKLPPGVWFASQHNPEEKSDD